MVKECLVSGRISNATIPQTLNNIRLSGHLHGAHEDCIKSVQLDGVTFEDFDIYDAIIRRVACHDLMARGLSAGPHLYNCLFDGVILSGIVSGLTVQYSSGLRGKNARHRARAFYSNVAFALDITDVIHSGLIDLQGIPSKLVRYRDDQAFEFQVDRTQEFLRYASERKPALFVGVRAAIMSASSGGDDAVVVVPPTVNAPSLIADLRRHALI